MFDAGKLRSVRSLDTSERSLQVAEIGRVVECSWMIVAGSWGRSSRWMQLDDRCGKLRMVESLNAAGRSLREAENGRVVECSWTIVVGSWGWSSRFGCYPVQRVIVASCCNARAVCNSESLHGLLEHRGR